MRHLLIPKLGGVRSREVKQKGVAQKARNEAELLAKADFGVHGPLRMRGLGKHIKLLFVIFFNFIF